MKKHYLLIIALLAGALGFFIAPPDLADGSYQATIDGITIPFEIGEEGEMTSLENVQWQTSYENTIGNSITYRVRANDSVPSVITGPGYRQELPPTGKEDGWYTFSMTIPYRAKIVTALLFFVAFLWLTEIIPLAAASLLIPVIGVVFGVSDAASVLRNFFHPIIVLFLAGFLMAQAMKKTKVDRLIALTILKHASLKPHYLMLTMMALTAFLSMWMSNTASVAIIIPIALAILGHVEKGTGYRKALVLGVAYAASIGGIGSAIGTPANILAFTFLNSLTSTNLAFVDWFAYGLPFVLLMIPITWIYLYITFKVSKKSDLDRKVFAKELKDSPVTKQQKMVLGIFVIIIGLWLTEKIHDIPTAIVALAGAISLFFLGILEEDDFNKINWNALLTFGGGLAIGSLLVLTGVSDWIALQLTGLAALPSLLVVLIIAAVTLIIGAFISNTACAAMLIPVAIPLARILGMDPRLLVGVIAIGSSIDFALIVGTPPTMMAYSTGIFKASEIFRRGIILDVLGVLLLSFIVVLIWSAIGVVAL